MYIRQEILSLNASILEMRVRGYLEFWQTGDCLNLSKIRLRSRLAIIIITLKPKATHECQPNFAKLPVPVIVLRNLLTNPIKYV